MNFKKCFEEKILKERIKKREEDSRSPYFRDQTAIIHSMSFRRLKNKTQVFFSPENDHVCTRIEHVLHVSTISTVICEKLGINYELAQAIALGHDLGHAPFGHAGEKFISDLSGTKFYHEINGLRVVDKLENDGTGLNLTYAVRDGIISHCGEKFEQYIEISDKLKSLEKISEKNTYPLTWEGCVVRMADKIAYLGRDIEDAIKADIISEENIPKDIKEKLGEKNGEIINTFVEDLIKWSNENGKIGFSENIFNLMEELKNFNYDKIYKSDIILNYKVNVKKIIEIIYKHLLELFLDKEWNFKRYSEDLIPLNKRFGNYLNKREKIYKEEETESKQIVVDYISGMTDAYALKCAKEIIFPKPISFDTK